MGSASDETAAAAAAAAPSEGAPAGEAAPDSKDLQQQSKALDKLTRTQKIFQAWARRRATTQKIFQGGLGVINTDHVEDRQLDSSRVQSESPVRNTMPKFDDEIVLSNKYIRKQIDGEGLCKLVRKRKQLPLNAFDIWRYNRMHQRDIFSETLLHGRAMTIEVKYHWGGECADMKYTGGHTGVSTIEISKLSLRELKDNYLDHIEGLDEFPEDLQLKWKPPTPGLDLVVLYDDKSVIAMAGQYTCYDNIIDIYVIQEKELQPLPSRVEMKILLLLHDVIYKKIKSNFEKEKQNLIELRAALKKRNYEETMFKNWFIILDDQSWDELEFPSESEPGIFSIHSMGLLSNVIDIINDNGKEVVCSDPQEQSKVVKRSTSAQKDPLADVSEPTKEQLKVVKQSITRQQDISADGSKPHEQLKVTRQSTTRQKDRLAGTSLPEEAPQFLGREPSNEGVSRSYAPRHDINALPVDGRIVNNRYILRPKKKAAEPKIIEGPTRPSPKKVRKKAVSSVPSKSIKGKHDPRVKKPTQTKADGEPKRVMKQSQQSSLQSKNQGTSSTTKQGRSNTREIQRTEPKESQTEGEEDRSGLNIESNRKNIDQTNDRQNSTARPSARHKWNGAQPDGTHTDVDGDQTGDLTTPSEDHGKSPTRDDAFDGDQTEDISTPSGDHGKSLTHDDAYEPVDDEFFTDYEIHGIKYKKELVKDTLLFDAVGKWLKDEEYYCILSNVDDFIRIDDKTACCFDYFLGVVTMSDVGLRNAGVNSWEQIGQTFNLMGDYQQECNHYHCDTPIGLLERRVVTCSNNTMLSLVHTRCIEPKSTSDVDIPAEIGRLRGQVGALVDGLLNQIV